MTDRALLLAELLADPGKAALVTREEALALAVDLARVAKALELRALSPAAPASNGNGKTSEHGDRLLDVHEAAKRLGLTERELYRRPRLPFRVKLGEGTLRFSERGIERYL